MLFILKRLALGLLLIFGASAILLLLDLDHRNANASASKQTARKWKVTIVEFNQVVDVEEAERGVLLGLQESGLQEGRNYEVNILNAQGDMGTVSNLVDSAITDRSDLLITLSTPTLQAAIRRAGRTPVVFTYVADAVHAGAGRSDTDHLPNITGLYFRSAFDETVQIVRECMPNVHRIGTLYVPAETNMVFYKDKLEAAAKKANIELVALPVNTSTDVPDAALALCTQNIDAIVQIPGNLMAAAFPSLAAAANKVPLPIFGFQTSHIQGGAVLALARDYLEAGRESGALAARVIRGANPAVIPFKEFTKTYLIVNLKSAKQIGFQIPSSIVQQAKTVIRD